MNMKLVSEVVYFCIFRFSLPKALCSNHKTLLRKYSATPRIATEYGILLSRTWNFIFLFSDDVLCALFLPVQLFTWPFSFVCDLLIWTLNSSPISCVSSNVCVADCCRAKLEEKKKKEEKKEKQEEKVTIISGTAEQLLVAVIKF